MKYGYQNQIMMTDDAKAFKLFFYPAGIAVFGVSNDPRNLARNIIFNCRNMGFRGEIFPVGRSPGSVYGREIITDAKSLPSNIDLAVILVPSRMVAETMEICGRKGIRHAVISTGGFSEFQEEDNRDEKNLLETAEQYGIRFIGPNCIGVICTNSGLCTPFNPLQTKSLKKGPVSLIAQSGGVTTQAAYHFSEEHVGFSKIVSAGNKLNLDEINFIEYLLEDEDTEQIHLYLESIDNGRELVRLARKAKKPIVVFKSNITRTASEIAKSHTAALANDDHVVDGALKQAGIIRVQSIHEMTVCAKALQLPPLKGNRLVVISLSGGFAVIIGDACEKHGFVCPELPAQLLQKIESFRRGGVIRMSNPMDFGDVHDFKALLFAVESCLSLDDIDGMILSLMYEPDITKMFGGEGDFIEMMLTLTKQICEKARKPIGLSFFAEKKYIDKINSAGIFPVFNSPVESVQGFSMLRDYWRAKNRLRI